MYSLTSNDEEWYRLKNGIRDLMLKTSNTQMFLQPVEEVTDDLIDAIYEERDPYNRQISNLADLIGRWNIEGRVIIKSSIFHLFMKLRRSMITTYVS